LLFDVARLIADWNLSQTWQVNECEVDNLGGVNGQRNRLCGDALVFTCNFCRLSFNFKSYGIEVGESLAFEVQEFRVFLFVGTSQA
jgi:hypothetical protein